MLLVLWIIPGGLADIVYRVRDAGLRWTAERRGIVVPSLVADVRQDPDPEPLESAEESVEGSVEGSIGSSTADDAAVGHAGRGRVQRVGRTGRDGGRPVRH